MMRRLGAGLSPAYLFGILSLLALAAALLWLLPIDPALAQDEVKGPKITAGPAIASSPASGDTYRAGEAITVTLTYGEPVTVTGKPRLRLNIGEKKRWAGYESASADGATLFFTHAVKPDDADVDGISIGRNQLKLNGGTITDADGNAARLKHPPLRRQEAHKVNGAPDEPEPPEPEPEPTATPTPEPEPQRAANNEPQFADATTNRSVNENAAAGTNVGAAVTATDDDGDNLTYALTGADAGSFDFDTSSGQLTVKAALNYEARASYAVTIAVHDGKDTAGEADASEDDTITVTVSVLNVDEAGVVSLLTENNAFEVGNEISAVLLDPDGGVNGETWIWQHSTDGNDWIAIADATEAAYTPTEEDTDHYLRATASYADGEGSGKTARAQTPGKVAAVVAASADPPPSITQGPILNTSKSGDTYGAGEEISVQLTFSEPVTVKGTPRLGIDIGENRRWAEYEGSTAGDTSLLFRYTVQADDRDDDGFSIAANALELNGGSIEDGDGNAANLGHPAVAALVTHQVDGSPQPIAGEPQNTQTTPTVHTVPANWPLLPADITSEGTAYAAYEGWRFRLLFVTSTKHAATATDIATYNGYAQAAADDNATLRPYKDEFRALISTQTVDARDNTGTVYDSTNPDSVAVYWVNGDRVADFYGGLYRPNPDDTVSTWISRTARDEDGSALRASQSVWTGSGADGKKHATQYAGAASVRVGNTAAMTSSLSQGAQVQTSQNAIYALSPVFMIADPTRPAKPTGVRVSPGDQSAQLRWNFPVGDDSVTGYQYQYKTVDGSYGEWTDIPNRDRGSGYDYNTFTAWYSYTVMGLDYGKTYVFRLRAVDTGGGGTASDALTVTAGAVWSANLTVRTLIAGRPFVGCHANVSRARCPAALTGNVFSYKNALYAVGVLYWNSSTNEVTLGLATPTRTPHTTIKTALGSLSLRSGAAEFRVADATATANHLRWSTTGKDMSGWTDGQTVAVELLPSKPAQPTGFTATPGDTQVTLRWENPDNSYITKWQYRYKEGSGNDSVYKAWTDISGASATSHTVNGLTNGTTYTFQVRAVSRRGNGPASAEQSARLSLPVWSATLTVDHSTASSGCDSGTNDGVDDCSSPMVLTDDDFTYGGVIYTIQVISWSQNAGNLAVAFTSGQGATIKTALGSLVLHVDEQQLTVSSASTSPNPIIRWNANPGWTDGQTVKLSLREAEPQIMDIRLKDNDSRFGVPINLINRGFQLIIEVEYDRELDYSSLPQAFPLMLGSFGGSANSEEELRKMGYKGEPSKTDPNTRYAELVRDRKWVSRDDGWYLDPVDSGKVITYKYTVRWGDLDDDGVSIVRPDTGAVMTFPQKVNGRH